jgi:hypothetical protein
MIRTYVRSTSAAPALQLGKRFGVEPVAQIARRPRLLGRRRELGEKGLRGQLSHLLPGRAPHGHVRGDDADLLLRAVFGRQALDQGVRVLGEPNLERAEARLRAMAVEDEDPPDALAGDPARQDVPQLGRLGEAAGVEQVVTVEQVEGRLSDGEVCLHRHRGL